MKKILLTLSFLFALAGIGISQISLRADNLTSTVEITRPANTTSYTALDAIASSSTAPTNLIFTSITRSGGLSGYITSAIIVTDQNSCTSRFRLHVFTSTVTAINDNAAYTYSYANNSIRVGTITFDACSTEGSGSTAAYSVNTTIRLPFKIPSGSSLYGLLETVDSFTPASGQKFFIQLNIDSN